MRATKREKSEGEGRRKPELPRAIVSFELKAFAFAN